MGSQGRVVANGVPDSAWRWVVETTKSVIFSGYPWLAMATISHGFVDRRCGVLDQMHHGNTHQTISIYLSVYLSVYLSICPPTHLPTADLPVSLSICLPPCMSTFICLHTHSTQHSLRMNIVSKHIYKYIKNCLEVNVGKFI